MLRKLCLGAALSLGVTPALAHEPFEWNDTTYTVLLSTAETDGRQGLFLAEVQGPGGPPMHVHDDADETFYILSGEADFVVDGQMVRLGKGNAAFVPRGLPHTYNVLSPEGASFVTGIVPAGFEAFFEAMATEDLKIPQDMPRIEEIAATFQLRFVGPPLAAR